MIMNSDLCLTFVQVLDDAFDFLYDDDQTTDYEYGGLKRDASMTSDSGSTSLRGRGESPRPFSPHTVATGVGAAFRIRGSESEVDGAGVGGAGASVLRSNAQDHRLCSRGLGNNSFPRHSGTSSSALESSDDEVFTLSFKNLVYSLSSIHIYV